jgi:hypothetical protein
VNAREDYPNLEGDDADRALAEIDKLRSELFWAKIMADQFVIQYKASHT